MSECQNETSCDTKDSCNCPNCGKEECCCSMEAEVLSLVKCAKHELLQEKMKKLLEVKIGKKLDKVAEVAVDAMLAKMEHKMAHNHVCKQYEDNLMAAWKT